MTEHLGAAGDGRTNGALPGGYEPGIAAFARAWAKAVTGTSYLPMTQPELEAFLSRLTTDLVGALFAEPFSLRRGHQVGADLVASHVASAEGLGRTIEVIDLRLLRDLGLAAEEFQDRMARLLGTVATGYARALRDRTLDEQESVRRAAMMARQHAEVALRDSEARFRHQARHDPLTGLPNRTLFLERLRSVFTDAASGRRRLGVCFIDLDGFKMINDTLGHHLGDLVLVAVADRLRQAVGQHLVARLGGDEFVVLLEDTTCTDDVLKIANAALAAINEPTVVDGHELTVSGSIGMVERAIEGTSPSDVMRAADVTLHWAKEAGRGRWALFDAARAEREVARYALSADMPGALDRGEFHLEYQPLVSLHSGVLVGVEALVRWQHPTLGLLYPDRFIGLAEETGLIVRLGGWVMAEACREARRWLNHSPSAPFVSVNLAVRQARDARLVDEVVELLARTGLPADRLQLEITESAVMSTADDSVAALRSLANLGVRIAIDDFGTGYSNLAYLRTLPVCELKVAGEFVEGLRRSPDDPAGRADEQILATLVALAHSLRLTVTAEGVETAAQADRLRSIGCDTAQGWHFGRPGTPAGIVGRLSA